VRSCIFTKYILTHTHTYLQHTSVLTLPISIRKSCTIVSGPMTFKMHFHSSFLYNTMTLTQEIHNYHKDAPFQPCLPYYNNCNSTQISSFRHNMQCVLKHLKNALQQYLLFTYNVTRITILLPITHKHHTIISIHPVNF